MNSIHRLNCIPVLQNPTVFKWGIIWKDRRVSGSLIHTRQPELPLILFYILLPLNAYFIYPVAHHNDKTVLFSIASEVKTLNSVVTVLKNTKATDVNLCTHVTPSHQK